VDASDVPAGPLAVDTDVFSFIQQKKDRYDEWSRLLDGHRLALPFPVAGELQVGAIRARLQQRRLDELTASMAACIPIPGDARVVTRWATIHARFVGRLKGGGVNDVWIAACCLVHELPLATNNLSDFQLIAGEFPELHLIHPDL
jgi:predicted nucleic acid-binding protein